MATTDLTNEIAPVHPYRPVKTRLADLRQAILDQDGGVNYTAAYLGNLSRNDLVYVARIVGANIPTTYVTAAKWKNAQVYALHARVSIGAAVLEATTAGTSGGSVPTVPGAVGGTVVDNTVTWTRVA